MEKKGIFELSAEAALLTTRINRMEVDEIVSYKEMNDLIGRNVQEEARGALQTARRTALRDSNIDTSAVRGVGIKRLSQAATAASSLSNTKKVGRIARREMKRLQSIDDYENLPMAAKDQRNAALSLWGVAAMISKKKLVDRITEQISANNDVVPPARMLDMFK